MLLIKQSSFQELIEKRRRSMREFMEYRDRKKREYAEQEDQRRDLRKGKSLDKLAVKYLTAVVCRCFGFFPRGMLT